MRERPILFSTPMVQAIIGGKKTMTRRTRGLDWLNVVPFTNGLDRPPYSKGGNIFVELQTEVDEAEVTILKCPYGEIGDRLWVRETWTKTYDTEDHPELPDNHKEIWGTGYAYKADGKPFYQFDKWIPSIHMPRSVSRITLEITDVKVEKLRNIDEGDAYKEGVSPLSNQSAIGAFYELWQSINGDGSWEVNPWVWAISFKKFEVK